MFLTSAPFYSFIKELNLKCYILVEFIDLYFRVVVVFNILAYMGMIFSLLQVSLKFIDHLFLIIFSEAFQFLIKEKFIKKIIRNT